MNEIIKWIQNGQVFFWRYTENIRNYPGWHLALDLSGGNSLLILLASMKVMNEPAMRTVRLTSPGPDVLAIRNNRRSGIVAKHRLRINWIPERKNEWSIEEQEDEIIMALGEKVLDNIAKAIENPKKAFDTTIAVDPFLWFWGIIDK